MKKLISATAVCAVAIGLVAVPGAVAKTSVKTVFGSVSVNVTPNPIPASATSVIASGNVASNSNCRKNRQVTLVWISATNVVTPAGGPVTTKPNGDYTVDVTSTKPAPGTYTLRATVAPATRIIASKRKGKKAKRGRIRFECQEISGTTSVVVQ